MGKTVNITVRKPDYVKFAKIAAENDLKLIAYFHRLIEQQEKKK